MKLIISESQLKRVINEIGGFDDKDRMGSHSTMIQNNIMVKVVETIKAMKATINLLDTDGIKTEILAGISQNERIVSKGAIFIKLAQGTGALDAHSGHIH